MEKEPQIAGERTEEVASTFSNVDIEQQKLEIERERLKLEIRKERTAKLQIALPIAVALSIYGWLNE